MQENFTLKVDGNITRPPYPAFKVPGFPLGTDSFGRDIVSRLLWAVRPTLILVASVALARLVLGILIGLWAGWATGRVGRTLDSIIAGALSIPVLIVALMVIAAVGIEREMAAFIFGWPDRLGETARLVSEQTRSIRTVYVEAAQALGASDIRVLGSHILRQIMPLVSMLLAFEVARRFYGRGRAGFPRLLHRGWGMG
jgi:ABC-type dipeptide/oligopeptide/nickel transport system permease subunit